MKNQINLYKYNIKKYRMQNYNNEITLNKIIPLILDSAILHADLQKCSQDYLLKNNYIWVLSRFHITETNKIEDSFEWLSVKTWVSMIKGSFTVRLFEVTNEKNKVIAKAISLWSILNVKTREVMTIKDVLYDSDVVLHNNNLDFSIPSRLKFKPEHQLYELTARYTDLDSNKHVSTTKYIDWVLDAIDLKYHINNKIKNIKINFLKEIYYQDQIIIYCTKKENNFDFTIFNKTQNTIAANINIQFSHRKQ